VHDWADFGVWEERRRELLREADERRLARGLREARAEERPGEGYVEWPEGVEVRWGLLEDEPKIADLLELNGMPRWIAFEERYIVAEKDGKILAALRYRTESKRLVLGLLVVDPWLEERSLAVALYAGAGELAREMGVGEILAESFPYGDYPREAGYRRRGRREWRLDATRSPGSRKELPAGGWRRAFALLGAFSVPFFRAFRG
jgi:predicted GNAT family acetyltransferase